MPGHMENCVRMDAHSSEKASAEKLALIHKQIAICAGVAWSAVTLGAAAGIFGVLRYWLQPGNHDLNALGQLGSYLQGGVQSLWSLAALLFIYVAFLGQREEFLRKDLELEKQSNQSREQYRMTVQQNFENRFFELLKMQSHISAQIRRSVLQRYGNTIASSSTEIRGKECFEQFHASLVTEFGNNNARFMQKLTEGFAGQKKTKRDFALEAYPPLFAAHKKDLCQYFGNLYQIVRMVKRAPVEDKNEYIELLEAQLSPCELVLLFYHAITIDSRFERSKQRQKARGSSKLWVGLDWGIGRQASVRVWSLILTARI